MQHPTAAEAIAQAQPITMEKMSKYKNVIKTIKVGQGFPAHKVAAVAAYRDRCQTKKETHMQGHVQRT